MTIARIEILIDHCKTQEDLFTATTFDEQAEIASVWAVLSNNSTCFDALNGLLYRAVAGK